MERRTRGNSAPKINRVKYSYRRYLTGLANVPANLPQSGGHHLVLPLKGPRVIEVMSGETQTKPVLHIVQRKNQTVDGIAPNLSHPLHIVPKVLDEVLSGVNRVGNQKVRRDLETQLLKQEKVLVKAVGLASATDEIPGHKGQLSLFGD